MNQSNGRRKFIKNMAAITLFTNPMESWFKKSHSPNKLVKPFNVIAIISDDLRPELGCYGANHIQSPNIDYLASQGMIFNNAYVQQAVCAPSRASFLTGCRPDTTGVDYPYSKWFVETFIKTHPDIQTVFFNNGFYSTTCGKVHHSDHKISICSEPHYFSNLSEWGGKRQKFINPKPIVEFMDVDDTFYRDGNLTQKTIKRLRIAEENNKSFFTAIGYWKPHLPFVCPQKYANLYDPEKIDLSPVPQFPENSPWYSHRGKRHKNESGEWELTGEVNIMRPRYIQNPGGFTKKFQRELQHGYYACVSFIDAQVGKIISELKKLNQWENTIIILWGDNGYHLGDHNWWTKGNNCEFDTRVPLIARIPGLKKGETTDALVETVDIFPTLLDACSIPIPGYVEGTSFLPLMKDPKRPWKKAVFSQYPRGYPGISGFKEGYTVRTHRYRYTEWRDNDGKVQAKEFYDYLSDPLESKNLVHEKRYKESIQKHEKILKEGWKKALPPGIINRSNNPRGNDSEYLINWEKKKKSMKPFKD